MVTQFYRLVSQSDGAEWTFAVLPAKREPGKYYLTIPSVTPHSFAADQVQRAWFERVLAQFDGLSQTWETTWTIESEVAVESVLSRLRSEYLVEDAASDAYLKLCDDHGRRNTKR